MFRATDRCPKHKHSIITTRCDLRNSGCRALGLQLVDRSTVGVGVNPPSGSGSARSATHCQAAGAARMNPSNSALDSTAAISYKRGAQRTERHSGRSTAIRRKQGLQQSSTPAPTWLGFRVDGNCLRRARCPQFKEVHDVEGVQGIRHEGQRP